MGDELSILSRPSRGRTLVLAAVVAVATLAVFFAVGYCARTVTTPERAAPAPGAVADTPVSGLPEVRLAELPVEAGQTLALVDAGGPFPYTKDGSVFGNLEGLLPPRPRGYYREYTVPTPGEDDRGARRLVVGADGDVFWTADHYRSFRQVRR